MTKLNRIAAVLATASTLPLMACSGTQMSTQMLKVAPVQLSQMEAPSINDHPSETEGPVWYQEAVTYLGTAEKKGDGNSNSLIEKMHNLTRNAVGLSDGIAWCASFTNYVLRTTAEKFNLPDSYAGTGSSGARHFQKPERYDASKSEKKKYPGWGTNVDVNDLHVGDVVAIIWDGSTKGHVGFVAATYTDGNGKVIGVWVMGGNQRNKAGMTETVNVALYMFDEAKRIVFKRPVGYKADPAHKAQSLTKVEANEKFGDNVGQRGSMKTSR